MSTANWSSLGSEGSNIASTALDSLANGSDSTGITLDNTSAKALYAAVRVELGSINPASGGSITLRVYNSVGGNVEDFGGGGVESQTKPLKSGSSAKRVIFNVRLLPMSHRLVITNNAGVTLAASGNAVYVSLFNEEIN